MLVSLNELRKYVDLSSLSDEEIANRLTFAGVEVEEIKHAAYGTNLVIGHILECEAHPDSDHLHVLKVDLGNKYGVEQIVCGAPNARKGLNVIVSRVGAKLPGGEIKKSTIRGVESNGMCCSLLELGVDSKYLNEYQQAGIEELPDDAPVGEENVLSYLGLDDTILDLNILANRPDLLSIYNVAKEVGALFNRKVSIPNDEIKPDFKTSLVVDSLTDSCTQFSSCEVKGIVTKPSPKWLVAALRSMGVRSINNIVDIGNYVMLMTGQPLHMYDADKLPKAELVARNDHDEDLIALDEKTYHVNNNDIVICSNNKAMCLGGIMGCLECAVDDKTSRVYIEAASFNGANIRRTSARLGLGSESSLRFVKGTNHFQYDLVLGLAVRLLKELADAKEVSNVVTVLKEEKKENVVSCSISKINSRLGTSFDKTQILSTLKSLNFSIKEKGNDEFDAVVPEYRLDVTCDADLSEEVIRYLGFDNVKSILPVFESKAGGLTLAQNRRKKIRELLLSLGLDECLSYSLMSEKEVKSFNLLNDEEGYRILNPLTDEREYVRTSLAVSMLKTASYNVAHQNKSLAIFETANVYTTKSTHENLGIILVGKNSLQGLLKEEDYDFYSIKGIVESIFELLGIEKSRYGFKPYSGPNGKLHPGKSADIIFQNQVIGRCGELFPTVYEEYDLGKTHAVLLELNLDVLLNAKVSFKGLEVVSKFPSVERDLALVIKQETTAQELIKSIKVSGHGLVSSAEVFDVYMGENIKTGYKSMAIKIVFTSDHTLVDKEVNEALDKIKFELAKNYQAELRI